GFEPTTDRLTADCSTTELLRNIQARRRPTLARGRPLTTIGAEKLNFRVRDGNGCFLLAIIAGLYELVSSFFQNWITILALTERSIRLSPRTISIRQLHTSPCFHPGPIDLVIYEGSY